MKEVIRSTKQKSMQFVPAPKPFSPGSKLRKGVLIGIGFVCLALIFTVAFTPKRVHLEIGQVCSTDIKAPRDIIDRLKTEILREEKASQVKEVYESDPLISDTVKREIEDILFDLEAIRSSTIDDENAKVERLKNTLKIQIEPGVPEALIKASPADFTVTKKAIIDISQGMMSTGIKGATLSEDIKQIQLQAESLNLQPELKKAVYAIVKDTIRPNMVLDASETQRRRQVAINSVEPVKILKGMFIIREGDVVTPEHLQILRDAGLLYSEHNPQAAIAASIFSLIIITILMFYLYRYRREIYTSEAKVTTLLGFIISCTVFAEIVQPISGYLAPVAATTMLAAILVDSNAALLICVILSIATGLISGGEFRYTILALFGSLGGMLSLSRTGHRYDLIRGGLVVSAVNILTISGTGLMTGMPFNQIPIWKDMFWGTINGVIISGVFTTGALPFLESLLNIITPMRLVDLSNTNQPLLNRLLVEAPGTYHHSVIVANLAEAATQAIGGNSLLARVGAYYHDIGKIKRPYFFIENQIGDQENPHDKISPTLSKMIITSHVKDGVDLAKASRLPDPIIDFIREHHGTTLVSYFYSKATGNEKDGESIFEGDFRYDGPKPHTNEIAIVMLADTVEAAVRSLTKPSPARIESMVKRIVADRLADHQLDKCDLTLRNLDTITETFTKVLGGIFHPRLEYPDTPSSGSKGQALQVPTSEEADSK